MHTYLITIVNGGGVEIYAQEIQAENENKALYKMLTLDGTSEFITICDGDTIKIEEV